MSKHLGILELKHFSRGKALLDDVDTWTSTLVIKASSLACRAKSYFRVAVAVDYLRLCVASTYIIIGTTVDLRVDRSSGKDGA